MINFKKFYKRIVFDADSVVIDRYVVTQNDTRSRGLYVEIYQNGRIVEIKEGNKLTFYGKKPDGKVIFVDAVVEDGLFRVDLPNQTFNIPGEIRSELTLRGSEDELLSKRLLIQVTPSFVDSGHIESHDDFTALQQALAEIAEFAGKIEDVRLFSENVAKDLGDINNLDTENKKNAVKAINELNMELGNKITDIELTETLKDYALLIDLGELEELETESKDNLVKALNEVLALVKELKLSNDNDYLVDLILQKADKKDIGNIRDLEPFEDGTKPNNLVQAVNYLFSSNNVILNELAKVDPSNFAKALDVGNLQNLTTEEKSSIVSSINEIDRKMKEVESVTNIEELSLMIRSKADRKDVGEKENLSTIHKENIVGAINEVYYNIKDIELLPGPQGPQGEPGQPGQQGEPGKDGSDATVTKDKIISELGFTPVSESVIGDINAILDMINGQ